MRSHGFCVFFCDISKYFLAVFRLGNHTFSKARLFFAERSVIHAFGEEQDMRKNGGGAGYVVTVDIIWTP